MFKEDPDFLENEQKYNDIKNELLESSSGSDNSNDGSGSGSESSSTGKITILPCKHLEILQYSFNL